MTIKGINGLDIEVSQEQIDRFKKLKSIYSKLDFWLNEFQVPYFYWNNFALNEIKDIMIKPNDSDETETLNVLILEQYEERIIDTRNPLKLFNIEDKRKRFIEEIEKSKNKILFKEREFKNIEKEKELFINKNTSPFLNMRSFFENTYFNYLHNNQEPDYSINDWELPHLISMENGYRMAQYYIFVENYKSTNLIDLSLNEKILLLEYLGVLDTLHTNSELSLNMTAKFINTLTGMDISNIEKSYRSSFIQKNHNKKNIGKVIQYIENIGLKTLSEDIRKKENFTD
jgi:hypothetical protein